MLPKRNRLTAIEIYNLKSTRLSKVYSRNLSIFSVANNTHLKVGIIISKKKLKRAVDRNQVKRQLYTLLRSLVSLDKKWTILIAPKDRFILLSTKEQHQELSQLLKQPQIIPSR